MNNSFNSKQKKHFLKYTVKTLIIATLTLATTLSLITPSNLLAEARTSPSSIPEVSYPDVDNFCETDIKCSRINRDLFVNDSLKNNPIPTNRIWSSVVFQGNLLGLFTMPIASRGQDGELKIGLPNLAAQINPKTVAGSTGGEVFGITGSDKGFDKVYLDSFSDLSVTLDFRNRSESIFKATFVQGSPYIFIKPSSNKLKLNLGTYKLEKKSGNNVLTMGDRRFGVFTDAVQNESARSIDLDFTGKSQKYLTLGVYTDDSSYSRIAAYAKNVITSVKADPIVNTTTVATRYQFKFQSGSNSSQTIFGLLPHQQNQAGLARRVIFKQPTIRGEQQFIATGSQLTITTPKQVMLENLPDIGFDDPDKVILLSNLTKDANDLKLDIGTSYFGAKQLAKAARLIQIADSLNQPAIRDQLVIRLESALDNLYSFSPGETDRYLDYDTTVRTIIVRKDEFGSDSEINDHHFHYGYQLYAAAILAKFSPEFRDSKKDIVDLLARDIATIDTNDSNFPKVRNFDFYEGHSWASGIQPFADGNNQESTSEAINAWYGLWLWGQVTGNDQFKQLGTYLYSSEIQSTNFYWLNRSDNKTIFPTSIYTESTASLVWGGKYDFATFFTADRLAIKGIQYLPYTAGSMYLASPIRVGEEYESVSKELNERSDGWVDLNLMYYATLKGKSVASIDRINSIPIDDGNSRTNLWFWIMYWDKVKNQTQSIVGRNYTALSYTENGKRQLILNCEVDNAVVIDGQKCKKGTVKLTDVKRLPVGTKALIRSNFSLYLSDIISNALKAGISLTNRSEK